MDEFDGDAWNKENEGLTDEFDFLPGDTPNNINSHDQIINQMNREHAVVMVGGKCLILNETFDPTFKRPDISFSTPTDFKNRYANKSKRSINPTRLTTNSGQIN